MAESTMNRSSRQRKPRVELLALLLPQTTAVVQDGIIRQVAADATVPAGIGVINGAGLTLLPSLIDLHVNTFVVDSLAAGSAVPLHNRSWAASVVATRAACWSAFSRPELQVRTASCWTT